VSVRVYVCRFATLAQSAIVCTAASTTVTATATATAVTITTASTLTTSLAQLLSSHLSHASIAALSASVRTHSSPVLSINEDDNIH
jgi:hypothetical protein